MAVNSVAVLDLSLTHLSDVTSAWMLRLVEAERDSRLRKTGKGPNMSIMEREEGFFLSSHHADPDQAPNIALPGDLLHVLRFAHLNGMQYVLFDRDADPQEGLPVYQWNAGPGGDINKLDLAEQFLGQGEGRVGMQEIRDPLIGNMVLGHIEAVIPDSVPDEDLLLHPAGQTIPDADHEAPEGCWLKVQEAALRIGRNEDAVWVEVFADGVEMGESFGRIEILRSDLALAREEAKEIEDENPPEP